MKKSVSINQDNQELENLRNKVIEKLYWDLNKRHNSILLNKDISAEAFVKEFSSKIENYFNFRNPDYKHFFTQMERSLIPKLNKLPDKKRSIIVKKESTFNNKCEETEVVCTPEKTLSQKQQREMDKKNNEWAKIANYEFDQYMGEKHRRDVEEMIAKQMLQEDLKKQVEDRKCDEQKEKERADKFYNDVFKKNIERLDIEEKEKQLKAKEMFLKQKELLLSSMEGMCLFLYRLIG
jgi:hypothetical protein